MKLLRQYWQVIRALMLVCALQGCSAGLTVIPVPQSDPLPSSSVPVPIGDAVGRAHHFDITMAGLPDHLYPEIMREAMQAAIRARQGDVLVDGALSMRATQFPLFVVPINLWWIEWTAEGIAAKVDALQSAPAGQDGRAHAK